MEKLIANNPHRHTRLPWKRIATTTTLKITYSLLTNIYIYKCYYCKITKTYQYCSIRKQKNIYVYIYISITITSAASKPLKHVYIYIYSSRHLLINNQVRWFCATPGTPAWLCLWQCIESKHCHAQGTVFNGSCKEGEPHPKVNSGLQIAAIATLPPNRCQKRTNHPGTMSFENLLDLQLVNMRWNNSFSCSKSLLPFT